MQGGEEWLDFLSNIWVYLGFGIFLTALGFAIILSDWRPYFRNPSARRARLLPVMIATYFLTLSSWIIGAIIHGHSLVAGGLIAMGVLQIFAVFYKYQLQSRLESTKQHNPLNEDIEG